MEPRANLMFQNLKVALNLLQQIFFNLHKKLNFL